MQKQSLRKKSSTFLAFGQRIAERRKAFSLNQAQFAELIGVEPETVSRIECGAVVPSVERLITITNVLNIGMAELFSQLPFTPKDTESEWLQMMATLTENDRAFVLGLVRIWVQRLKSTNAP